MKISVIVASHRPAFIPALLDALKAQSFGQDSFEVIVAADYLFESLQPGYPWVKWVYLDDRSISAKRNKGVLLSHADILAFVDDDCIPDSSWLTNAYTYLTAHPECSAVEGLTTIEAATLNTGLHKEYKRLEKPGFRTNNIFYRRDEFIKVGGFDERFSVQREDADLAFSVLEHGGKIEYCKDISVKHRFRYWEKWDLLKNCWNRRFDPLLYKKHPRLYRKYIKTPVSPAFMVLLGTYFVQVFSIFSGSSRGKGTFLLTIFCILGITVRRTGIKSISTEYLFFNLISVILAPVIIVSALLAGSIRFRKLLIV